MGFATSQIWYCYIIISENKEKMANPDQLNSEKKINVMYIIISIANAVCHSLKIGIIFGIISHRKGYIISRNGLCWISCHTTKRPIENKKRSSRTNKIELTLDILLHIYFHIYLTLTPHIKIKTFKKNYMPFEKFKSNFPKIGLL